MLTVAILAMGIVGGCAKNPVTNTVTIRDTVTTVNPPAVPTLSSPANTATSVSLTPTLTWNSVTGATFYNLQIATDSEFLSIIIDKAMLTSTSTNIVSALDCGRYFWRVNAANGGGISGWSGVWSFKTKEWCALGSGVGNYNYSATTLFIDNSGNLYAQGNFSSSGIAKWNGSTWSTPTKSPDSSYSLTVDKSGNIYTVDTANIYKYNGSTWSSIGTGIKGNIGYSILDGSGNLYVARKIVDSMGNLDTSIISKWNGSTWSNLGTKMNAGVTTLAIDGSGNLYAGGNFDTVDGIAVNHIAKWNGSTWSALGSGLGGSIGYSMCSILVDGSGNLYVGGQFITAGSTIVNRVAKWNGSEWSALGSGINDRDNSGWVSAMALDSSGNIYLGGGFTSVGGVAAKNIAKWNGSVWSALGSELLNGPVAAIAADKYGNIYAGGNFTTAGNVSANFIAVWK